MRRKPAERNCHHGGNHRIMDVIDQTGDAVSHVGNARQRVTRSMASADAASAQVADVGARTATTSPSACATSSRPPTNKVKPPNDMAVAAERVKWQNPANRHASARYAGYHPWAAGARSLQALVARLARLAGCEHANPGPFLHWARPEIYICG